MIIGHRGASAVEAENTLEAFEEAISAGADGVEFDIRLTSDGYAVLMHDPDVARTTDGSGLVRSMTLAEVRRLRIRRSDGALTSVPTLAETLASLSGRVLVDIEIKNIPGQPDFDADGEPAVVAALAAIQKAAYSGALMLTSFNPFSLAAARRLDPQMITGLLIDKDVDAFGALAYAHSEGHAWLLPHMASVISGGRALIEAAHALETRVGVWLTDDPEQARALFALGVDAVATNDPAALAKVHRGGAE